MRPSKTEIQKRDANAIGDADAENYDKLMLRADLWTIGGSAVVGLGTLIVLSFWLAVGRIPFIVVVAVPLFTLIAIIYHAVVYHRQWKAMRESVDLSKQSLRVANRAYVGVHSLREDFKNETIFLMLENIGNIPAKSVKVIGEVWIVRHHGSGLSSLGQVDSAGCPFSYEFGKTWLFRGNLKAQVIISIFHITLKGKAYIPSVIDGSGTMWVTGRIEYEDGFDSGQITEFAFIYIDGEWMVRGIDVTEQSEDKGQAGEEKANPN